MKNFDFIQAASEVLKSVNANLREANRELNSLSSVLKDIQRKKYMEAGYAEVFARLGLPTDGTVTPRMLFDATESEQWGQTYNKAGEQVGDSWLGVWGMCHKKNENGEKMYAEDGRTPIMEAKLRKITAWSANKFFKVYSQAMSIKAQKAAK